MPFDTRYVRGADKLKARIASVTAALSLPVLTNEIGNLLLRRTLQRFDREEDPDGQRWVALAEKTEVEKRRKGFETKGILRRTDKLRNSIKLVRGGAGSFAINTGAGVRIGISDPAVVTKARALNYGTRDIPARRFLGIGRLDVKAVDSLLRRKAVKLETL